MPCHKIPLMPPLKSGHNWQLFPWHKSKLYRYNFRGFRVPKIFELCSMGHQIGDIILKPPYFSSMFKNYIAILIQITDFKLLLILFQAFTLFSILHKLGHSKICKFLYDF